METVARRSARAAKNLSLPGVPDANPVCGAVSDFRSDGSGEMMEVQHGVLNAGLREPPQDAPRERHAGHRQRRLRT